MLVFGVQILNCVQHGGEGGMDMLIIYVC